jgi:diadenosine tetraphosphatase ApaH/serine/threonine PP2A family protein phosphatase
MKYGILGDIHANLEALRSVLERFDQEGVERVLSVGDIVGYGAAPAQCIELVREIGADVVMGNHDAAVVGALELLYFNNYARQAVRWTQSILSREHGDWLAQLPYRLDFEHCSLAHGTYARPELFGYVQGPAEADASLEEMPRQVAFIGHTHVPKALVRMNDDPGRTALLVEDVIELADVHRALLNVGSVGQPRDDDPRAAYAVYDTEARRVWIRRVEYDIEREAARIIDAGLPRVLADRLRIGV